MGAQAEGKGKVVDKNGDDDSVAVSFQRQARHDAFEADFLRLLRAIVFRADICDLDDGSRIRVRDLMAPTA